MADRIPPTVEQQAISDVEGPCVLPSGETPKQHSSGRAPRDLAEDRLDDASARFSLGNGERRLMRQFGQGPAQPAVGFVFIPERLFRERLGAQEPDRAIGFLDREGLLLVGPMPARPLWDHEELDLLFGQAGMAQPLEGSQGQAVSDYVRQVRLRADDGTQHGRSAEFARDFFNNRGRQDLPPSATCL